MKFVPGELYSCQYDLFAFIKLNKTTYYYDDYAQVCSQKYGMVVMFLCNFEILYKARSEHFPPEKFNTLCFLHKKNIILVLPSHDNCFKKI